MALGTLSTRVAVPAGIFSLVSVAAFSAVLIRAQRRQVLSEAVLGSEAVAETLLHTTEGEMAVNARDAIRDMIRSVGRQTGVVGVRIYNKDGRISFSSDSAEVGRRVSMRSPACAACHTDGHPPTDLAPSDRSREWQDEAGHRYLTTIRVIANQEGCRGADCHAAPSVQSVLGVLGLTVDMDPAQARISAWGRRALLWSVGAAALITALLALIIHRTVRRPIDALVQATREVAEHHGAIRVPEGASAEIRILAGALADLVAGLTTSRSRMQEWARSLESSLRAMGRELRQARDQVVRAEKLSSVGMVAAGIAHELNSPLMAIITFTHLVRRRLDADDPAHEDLATIEREANRCAGIIRQLLDYTRSQSDSAAPQPVDVSHEVGRAADLLRVELQNAGIELILDVPPDLPAAHALGDHLMQVLVNLLLNAVHAMPEGGRVEVSADVVDPSSLEPRPDLADPLPPQAVRIRVKDSGTGIDPDHLSRVFDPFFTTKPVGRGSGLGLAVSLGLARAYGGTITAASDGRTGSTFSVFLPLAPTSAPALAS